MEEGTMFSERELQSLNTLEMMVYNYVCKNREKVVYMKIRELAAETHVSTTTILHMCKKFGCEGYTEFKLRLKQDLLSEKQGVGDLDISAIQDYINRLSRPEYQARIDRAVEMLRDTMQIVFIGVGNSSALAQYGARYFCNVGCFAIALDDPFTPIGSQLLRSGGQTVVVALSVSGETQEILRMARDLKEHQCKLISITNSANCTLAQISELNLNYYMPDLRVNGYFQLTSQAPVVCLLEMIGRRLYQSEPDDVE
ncbi:MAG: MurR/RpiR family transcriptional regulator [Faecalibacterium sp.]